MKQVRSVLTASSLCWQRDIQRKMPSCTVMRCNVDVAMCKCYRGTENKAKY